MRDGILPLILKQKYRLNEKKLFNKKNAKSVPKDECNEEFL